MRKGFVAVAFAGLLAVSHGASAQVIGMGTTQVGGFQHTTAAALGKVIEEKTDLNVRVQSFGSGSQYLPLINSGELDISLSSGTEVAFAYAGREWFDGQNLTNLRAVAALVPNLTGYFVKKDSDIETVADLKGKKVSVGFDAQPVAGLLARSVLATAGLTEADLDGVPVPHINNSIEDFLRGRTDAYYSAVMAGKNAEIDAEMGGIRLVEIDPSAEAVTRASEIAPLSFAVQLGPDDKVVGIDKATDVLGAGYLLTAGAHVSDQVVYDLLKVLYENQPDLIKASKNFEAYNPDEMVRDASVPYHPGAIKFFKEHGLWSENN